MLKPVSGQGTGLTLVRDVAGLRAQVAQMRAAGKSVGLVPTMGALHEGHLSLIERARAQCQAVVVSIFVNPRQFEQASDLLAYPRCEEHDAKLLAAAGVDLLFAPSIEEIYPHGFASAVDVGPITERFEGAVRGRSHFLSVATVVLKLLNMCAPDLLYLGRKDAQQVAVIMRMVADLNLPVQVVPCPTVREADGLACSSRNARLSAGERARASALYGALQAAAALARAGERDAGVLSGAVRAHLERNRIEPEYCALVDPERFTERPRLDGRALLIVAARIGDTRLIDNIELEPALLVRTSSPPAEALCSA
jgi:pantoate--beta-alanine ligase